MLDVITTVNFSSSMRTSITELGDAVGNLVGADEME